MEDNGHIDKATRTAEAMMVPLAPTIEHDSTAEAVLDEIEEVLSDHTGACSTDIQEFASTVLRLGYLIGATRRNPAMKVYLAGRVATAAAAA